MPPDELLGGGTANEVPDVGVVGLNAGILSDSLVYNKKIQHYFFVDRAEKFYKPQKRMKHFQSISNIGGSSLYK